jgi:hypothetical protein
VEPVGKGIGIQLWTGSAYKAKYWIKFEGDCTVSDETSGRSTITIRSGSPLNSTYWVSNSDTSLSNEVNLGALTSGILKHTVTGGVSTPSVARLCNA